MAKKKVVPCTHPVWQGEETVDCGKPVVRRRMADGDLSTELCQDHFDNYFEEAK